MGEILARHFASVSAHGLSNFAGAQRLWPRIFWLFLFLVASGAFITHLTLLVGRYQSHPVNTQLSIGAVEFQFPSLVVCNPFPISLSWHGHVTQNWTLADQENFKKFIDTVRKAYSSPYMYNILKQLMREGKDVLDMGGKIDDLSLWIMLMWSSLPRITLIQPPNISQFIIKISVNGKDLDIRSFQAFTSQEYHTCYRFMNSSLIKYPTDKLTLYFYTDVSQIGVATDKSERFAALTYSGSLVDDKSSGVMLFFTEASHYPGYGAELLTASCGMHTKIAVSMTANDMISTTNQPCRVEPKTVDIASHLPDGNNVTYILDRSLCETYEWSLEYHSHCGCIPLGYPVPAHLEAQTSRCLNVTHWSANRTVENIKCMSRILFESRTKQTVESRCKGIDTCKHLTHALQWSNAVWPTSALAEKFSRDILQKSFLERNKNNKPAPAWRNVLDANDSIKIRMIRENIAKVDIRPKAKRSPELKESAAYPAMNLFSDIGGILGLYLGMSLLSVFELLESVIVTAKDSTKVAVSKTAH